MSEMENMVMETENTELEAVDTEVSGGPSKGLTGLIVGGLITAATVGTVAVVKKIKGKKSQDEPKKKVKKRLRLVEIEEDVKEEVIDSEATEVEDSDEE